MLCRAPISETGKECSRKALPGETYCEEHIYLQADSIDDSGENVSELVQEPFAITEFHSIVKRLRYKPLSAIAAAVVEDDPIIAYSLREVLECFGCPDVEVYALGKPIIEDMRAGRQFDLVTIDVRLADGSSGLTLCNLIRQQGEPHPLIICVSGFIDDDELQTHRGRLYDVYIQKPFEFMHLFKTIVITLARRNVI
jgi:CheY-like chemotaxis protein